VLWDAALLLVRVMVLCKTLGRRLVLYGCNKMSAQMIADGHLDFSKSVWLDTSTILSFYRPLLHMHVGREERRRGGGGQKQCSADAGCLIPAACANFSGASIWSSAAIRVSNLLKEDTQYLQQDPAQGRCILREGQPRTFREI